MSGKYLKRFLWWLVGWPIPTTKHVCERGLLNLTQSQLGHQSLAFKSALSSFYSFFIIIFYNLQSIVRMVRFYITLDTPPYRHPYPFRISGICCCIETVTGSGYSQLGAAWQHQPEGRSEVKLNLRIRPPHRKTHANRTESTKDPSVPSPVHTSGYPLADSIPVLTFAIDDGGLSSNECYTSANCLVIHT